MNNDFTSTVEVVPPPGPDSSRLLAALEELTTDTKNIRFDAFSIATNPVAKPRLSALALGELIKRHTGKQVIIHCTTRDHNRLSMQSLLWGAKALGVNTVLAATGDTISPDASGVTSHIKDVDVFELITMCRNAELSTGAVFTPYPDRKAFDGETDRLKKKRDAGAQFAVTQPVYTDRIAEQISEVSSSVGIPILLGILPLVTVRHAVFLRDRVAGIFVPEEIVKEMQTAESGTEGEEAAGIALARNLFVKARTLFRGVCIMPPFNKFYLAARILE
jgi:methylenetetrahydrofolate reductase (NADPH)